MDARRSLCFLILSGLLALSAGAARSAEIDADDEYARRIKVYRTIQPAGDTPFGEQINLYTGALSFRQVDVVLEGTGPSISLTRNTATLLADTKIDKPHAFGDWTLSIPRIETLVDKSGGWFIAAAAADKHKRCSLFDRPWYPTQIEKGWFGIELVDGAGDRHALLKRATGNTLQPAMTDAHGAPMAFPIVTQGNWQVACLPSTRNGQPGEAFLAVDPSGTRYWFDHLVYDTADTITENDMGTIIRQRRALATMFVSRIVDRFGNTIVFDYGGDDTLDAIAADDGREVAIAWRSDARLVDRIIVQPRAAQPRIWRYEYRNVTADSGELAAVVMPDASRWGFALRGLGSGGVPSNARTKCGTRTLGNTGAPSVSRVTSPAGLTGTFEIAPTWHARSYVPSACAQPPNSDPFEDNPPLFGTGTLVRKTFEGPGVPPQSWSYAFAPAVGSTTSDACAKDATCADTKWVDVLGPDGNRARYTYANRWGPTEGKLLRLERFQGNPGVALRTESHAYAAHDRGPWPASLGHGFEDARSNASKSTTWTPQVERTIVQQGRTFRWRASSFDAYSNPLTVTRSSDVGPGYSRTDTTAYHNDTRLWVLGQVASSTNTDATPHLVESSAVFDHATALPTQVFAFGQLQRTLAYDARGHLSAVSDGRDTPAYDTTVALTDFRRGIPQTIRYPDGTSRSAHVDDFGQIEWVQDEAGHRTCHRFDAMGRLAGVFHPNDAPAACDLAESQWNAARRTFEQAAVAQLGLAPGHWVETQRTGAGVEKTYFDALWRPVVTERYDDTNAVTRDATLSQRVTRYAPLGGVAFESYPLKGVADYASVVHGTRTTYDALGRPTEVRQDSELGVLATHYAYLDGFQSRVTPPRGVATTTQYQAFDQPATDRPVYQALPEGVHTDIPRDVFGKPRAITRRTLDRSLQQTRLYRYDAAQRQCATYEPETGTTMQGYDAAGNVAWSASGLPWGIVCDADGASTPVAARKSTRTYDQRNRLIALEFADDIGEQVWTYTPDGLPKSAWTWNGPGRTEGVYNAWRYNGRRMLDGSGEMQHHPGRYTWTLGYGYDRNGAVTARHLPDTSSVLFQVDALGSTTGISGTSGTYVSNASRHPNGALQGFTYGNGIAHEGALNARGLPDRSRDAHGGIAVFDDSYAYDGNGNLAAISDGLPGGHGDRTMTYDALDRLASVSSPSFNGTIGYAYDVLDNLRTLTAPARAATGTMPAVAERKLRYCYLSNTNALQLLKSESTDCTDGTAVSGFHFDVQGNLANRDGHAYDFSQDNRLRAVRDKETYRYDAHGRRVQQASPTRGTILSFYDREGRLAFQKDERTGKNLAYVSLDDRLVMVREQPTAGGAPTLKFQHTDALGTPVAVTGLDRKVLERSHYEPYGALINRPIDDGPGYTGHVEDAQTQLTYMQQRYYDSEIGRFTSIDPTVVDTGTVPQPARGSTREERRDHVRQRTHLEQTR
ncbi:Bacteriocin ORF-A [Lysobacter dokdonensis DS-58]|uniref:Bacteriocin ORF-A n=1 Tax=Lysobacter dokdonensis DS-58 TaxID=1300345 RepID=A0A0A2WMJ5_9GAMM|nr:RHS repeat-associated core domain-containing protein [Lysobacter dokdonensis]KGQ19957.1 Bacteriocin ORF-A [Lysobacter dokdonensis DS-58]